MEVLRSKLLKKADNIVQLGIVLRDMDRDKDSVLSLTELKNGVAALGLDLSADQVAAVFKELDKDISGTLTLEEFFVAVRGCLSEAKMAVLMRVYKMLDKDDSGVISKDDLMRFFDSTASEESSEQTTKVFMMIVDRNADGKVSKEEYLNFHAGMAEMSDEIFVEYMTKSWKLSA